MATKSKTVKVKPWRVVSVSQPNRTLLADNEDSARAYLAANFPRPHSEAFLDEPVYSAHLVSPDGDIERYHVDSGFAAYDPAAVDTNDDADDDEEDD